MRQSGGTQVWGVLNVTPDSFSDGGRFVAFETAVKHGLDLAAAGADVVDVGGESTRPRGHTYGQGFEDVPANEELNRVLPVVEALVAEGVCVSIDTVKPAVAEAALRAGASFVNDVSCATSSPLLRAAADAGAVLVVMHNRGRGEVTAGNTVYGNVVDDVVRELLDGVERACANGLARDRVWIDPGLGFAKTWEQSLLLLAHLPAFVATGLPVLVGASRKSFLAEALRAEGGTTDLLPVDQREGATAAATALSTLAGARAVRVHDACAARQIVDLLNQTRRRAA